MNSLLSFSISTENIDEVKARSKNNEKSSKDYQPSCSSRFRCPLGNFQYGGHGGGESFPGSFGSVSSNLPTYCSSNLPIQHSSDLPSQGSSDLPNQGSSDLLIQRSSYLPSQGSRVPMIYRFSAELILITSQPH